MKKFLYMAAISMAIWSCGGGGDDPAPIPEPENNAPTTPVQVYPANNELCINNAVNFQWNASTDPEGNPISYVVEVSQTSSFSTLIATKTVTSTSTSISLEKGIAYYWRVTAKDSKGLSSTASSANSFYTEGEGVSNYLPFSPELVAPSLGATVQTATATLEWTANDVDNDPLSYDVYLDTVNPPVSIVSTNQTTLSFTTSTLTASTTYYWKVVVKDDKGGQTIGQIWSFTKD